MSGLISNYSFNLPNSVIFGQSATQDSEFFSGLSVGEIADVMRFRHEREMLHNEQRDPHASATATSNGYQTRYTTGARHAKESILARNAANKINFIVDEQLNGINVAQDVVQTLWEQTQEVASSVWEKTKSWAENTWDAARDGATKLFNDASQAINDYVVEPLGVAVDRVGEGLSNLKDRAISVTRDMYEGSWLESGVQSAKQTLDNAKETVSNAYEGSWLDQKVDSVGESLDNMKDNTVDVAREAYEGSWLQSSVNSVKGFFSSNDQTPDTQISGASPASEVHGPAFEGNSPALCKSFSNAVTPPEETPQPEHTPNPDIDQNPSMTANF